MKDARNLTPSPSPAAGEGNKVKSAKFAGFRAWCAGNGYPKLAEWPDDEFPFEEWTRAYQKHCERPAVVAPREDPSSRERMTLAARIADEIDRKIGVCASMQDGLAIRVTELARMEGKSEKVLRYAGAVKALRECVVAMMNVIGHNNSLTYDQLMLKRNEGKHRDDSVRSGLPGESAS